MVDEMRDCSCKELMAICIRYCHSYTVNERCIGVVEAKKLDASSLTDIIHTTLIHGVRSDQGCCSVL